MWESPALDITISYLSLERFISPAEDGDLLQGRFVLDPPVAQPDALNLILLQPGSGHPLSQTSLLSTNQSYPESFLLTLRSDSTPRRKIFFSWQKSGRLHSSHEDLMGSDEKKPTHPPSGTKNLCQQFTDEERLRRTFCNQLTFNKILKSVDGC